MSENDDHDIDSDASANITIAETTTTTTTTTSPTPTTPSNPAHHGAIPSPPESPKEASVAALDGPPDDKEAFFGHPLTRATIAISGEDESAQAEALLHEYLNLQSLDKEGGKIGDRFR
jgi:hypothetical protein